MYKYTIATNRTDGVKEDTVLANSVHYGQDWIKFYTEDKADRELNPVFSVRAGIVVFISSEVETIDYEKKLRKAGISNVPVPDPSCHTREDLDREIRHLRELFESQIDNVAQDLEMKIKERILNLDRILDSKMITVSDTSKRSGEANHRT